MGKISERVNTLAQEDPIRIAYLLEAMVGGTRKHLIDLVENLDRDQFQPCLFCSSQRDPGFAQEAQRLREQGVPVTLLPMRRQISPWWDLVCLIRLAWLLRKGRYDLVHTHSSKAGILGRAAARLAGVPVVIHTPHAFPFMMKVGPLTRLFYIWLERIAARFTDLIIAVSEGERQAALQVKICPPEKILTIENGLNLSQIPSHLDPKSTLAELGVGEHDLVVGTVGRASRQKGWRDLVLAANEVVKELPWVKFLLVGGGELLAEIAGVIEELGLGRWVSLVGNRQQIYSLYAGFDVFVLPSLWEGGPYALLEAMAMGKPVVATRVAGNADMVVEGETGYLVPPEQPKALAQALLRLLRDSELRGRMGSRGRARIEQQFQLTEKIDLIQETYRRVWGQKK